MNNFSKFTETEIIEKWGDNPHWRTRRDIEEFMYKKYIPVCKKYSSIYKGEFEDNMQECYLIMLNSLEYAYKIIGKWDSFGGVFKSRIKVYLQKKINIKDTAFFNEIIPVAFTEESLYNSNVENFSDNKIDFDEDLIFNDIIDEFFKTLTDKEQQIYIRLSEKQSKKDIAKQMNISSSVNVVYWMNRMKLKYVSFMRENGYNLAY